jgi:3-hydroxyisobutyrate dehydrogenase-like beta-hydroxyacid dehydrogenase
MTTVKRSLNLGVVGLGRMGAPIARNLAFKSRTAVYLQLHSRNISRARKLSDDLAMDGAQCAMRLHHKYETMTKWCDVILTAVADRAASRYVHLEAPDALLRNARPGQIIVDHTTIDVETAKEYDEVARKRGAFFLDAPMSGSPQAAMNGQLTLMVGGDQEMYSKILPMMRLYGDTIHRMGGCGTGSATKAIISMLVAAHSLAAAEALTMAHAVGIDDSENLLKVLDASWGSSTMLRRNAQIVQRLLRNPETPPPVSSASMTSVLSDVGLLQEGAALNGPQIGDYHYPLLHMSCNALSKGVQAGVGDRDISGVVQFLECASSPTPPTSSTEEYSSSESPTPVHQVSRYAEPTEEVEFY